MASTALAQPEPEALPRRLGRYVLFDQIGEGGMARIYLARVGTELGGDRLVVVKEILPILAASDEFSRLLIDEAKLCSRLSHKNVVQVFDLGREGKTLYIAMEYVEGLDLRDLLRRCSRQKVPLPVEFSLYVVLETLRALDYAHRKRDDEGNPLGIVHRDVSPSNVLLSVEGEVKLCDFGIARAITTGDALPQEAIQGKAGYMSPETARGDAVDARADLFSVGVILYELLSGQRLYRKSSDRPEVIEQARAASILPLPLRGYPDEERLQRIVMTALERDPEGRYPSAHEMLRELEAYALDNRLAPSSLRFGEWLLEHFGNVIVEHRRERERAARRLDDAGTSASPPAAGDAEPVSEQRSAASGAEAADEPGQKSEAPGPTPSVRVIEDSSGGQLSLVLVVVLAVIVGGLLAAYLLR